MTVCILLDLENKIWTIKTTKWRYLKWLFPFQNPLIWSILWFRLYVTDLTMSFKILNDMTVCILLNLKNKIWTIKTTKWRYFIKIFLNSFCKCQNTVKQLFPFQNLLIWSILWFILYVTDLTVSFKILNDM